MDLSIVIINFRTFEITCNCIHSIHETLYDKNYEIILVDNAPLKDERRRFSKIFPNIIYISTSENLGFARANNLGIEQAKGRFILLLNSDTVVLDKAIQDCIEFLEEGANMNVGLMGCKLLNKDYTFQRSFYPFLKHDIINYFIVENPLLYRVFNVEGRYKEPMTPMKVGDVSGAFMLLRREVIEKVKAFDPDFFLYAEETEWCRNRIAKNYDIVYYPAASVIHLGGQSTPQHFMYGQFRLSLSLAWYKRGYLFYIMYLFISYFNWLLFCIGYIFLKNKDYYKLYIQTYWSLFPELLFEIPKSSKNYGSRENALIYKKAKKYFH